MAARKAKSEMDSDETRTNCAFGKRHVWKTTWFQDVPSNELFKSGGGFCLRTTICIPRYQEVVCFLFQQDVMNQVMSTLY